jgi:hypothetical protein
VKGEEARLRITHLELSREGADGLGQFEGLGDIGRKAAQLGARDVVRIDAEEADGGGVGVFDGAVMREHDHALAEGIQHRLHEVALALEATGEDRKVLRVEVVDTAEDAVKRAEATTGHGQAERAATRRVMAAMSWRATAALEAGPITSR